MVKHVKEMLKIMTCQANNDRHSVAGIRALSFGPTADVS